MDNDLLLDMPWPADLDPATVRFKGRSETVLRRRGLYDDWSLFSELTEGEVSSWWNAGPATIKDIRTTGNEAIRRHHDTVDLRRRIDTDLAAVALEPWAPHIWHWDPRFAMFVPKGDSTVCDIATLGHCPRPACPVGSPERSQGHRGGSRLCCRSPKRWPEYIDAVSGQHGQRLDVLLAVTGLNGHDPITRTEAARRLNVSRARIYQIVQQMDRRLVRARPQDGAWLPQLSVAERTQWPGMYTGRTIEATRSTFAPQEPTRDAERGVA